jgi:hypothetical protein
MPPRKKAKQPGITDGLNPFALPQKGDIQDFKPKLIPLQKPTLEQRRKQILEQAKVQQVQNAPSVGGQPLLDQYQLARQKEMRLREHQDAGYTTDSEGRITGEKPLTKLANTVAPLEKLTTDLADWSMIVEGANMVRPFASMFGSSVGRVAGRLKTELKAVPRIISDNMQAIPIANRHAGLAGYMKDPVVRERLNRLGITDDIIDGTPLPKLTNFHQEGSHYNSLTNQLNIDVGQKRWLDDMGHEMSLNQVYDHERGHFFQRLKRLSDEPRQRQLDHQRRLYYNLKRKIDPHSVSGYMGSEESNLGDYYKSIREIDEKLNSIPMRDYRFVAPTEIDELASFLTADPKKLGHPFSDGNHEYFKSGVEALPHLTEMRTSMIEKKIIKDHKTPITEEHLKAFFKKAPKNRIVSFMEENEDNFRDLKHLLNNLPAAAPVVVGAGAAAASQKNKNGGTIKKKKAENGLTEEDPMKPLMNIPKGYLEAMQRIGAKLPTQMPAANTEEPSYRGYQESQANQENPMRLSIDKQQDIAAGTFGYKKQGAPYNGQVGDGLLTGLMGVNALIPGEPIKDPVVRPKVSYNAHEYGTGSQAIYKYGGAIKKALFGMTETPGGEDPTNPPKQYRRLNPQQMTEWNGFLDFVKQQGAQGSKNLDMKNKKLGAQLFDKYKATNPNLSIDYSWVPDVQNEFNMANSWSKKKAGYLMADPSKVDGWFGSKTSQQYFVPLETQTYHNGQLQSVVNNGLLNGDGKPTGQATGQPPVKRTRKPQYGDAGAVEINGQMYWPEEVPMKNGGKLCYDMGGDLPVSYQEGQSYDLDPATIKSLLDQGYEIDF